MSPKPMPDFVYVSRRLDYDGATGIFLWRTRPPEHFLDAAKRDTWNTRYAGKPAGFAHGKGYRQIAIDDIKFMAHRLAWLITYRETPEEIDHIDGDRANNRISNLRAVTRAENLANMRTTERNTSGAKGVSFDRQRGKFAASITHLHRQYHLGRFDTLEQAAAARREAAERLQGKFARHE